MKKTVNTYFVFKACSLCSLFFENRYTYVNEVLVLNNLVHHKWSCWNCRYSVSEGKNICSVWKIIGLLYISKIIICVSSSLSYLSHNEESNVYSTRRPSPSEERPGPPPSPQGGGKQSCSGSVRSLREWASLRSHLAPFIYKHQSIYLPRRGQSFMFES